MKYLLGTSPRRPLEVWRSDGRTLQPMTLRDGELVERGQPSTPSIFESHRNVTATYGGVHWREASEAEAVAVLRADHITTTQEST